MEREREGEREKERKSEREGDKRRKERKAWGRLCGDSRALPLMGTWYELFVGCSLAFSHCYATFLRVLRFPFSFFLSSLLSFSRTFALSLPQRESMSMRKRFVSAFRLRESHEASKICVFTPLETDISPSFSTRRNNHVYGYLDGSILTRLW